MTDNPSNPETGTESTSAETQKAENMVPQSRVNTIVAEKNEYKQRLQELENEIQKNREKELSEQKRYQELYEDAQKKLEALKPYEETTKRYQEALQATLETRLQQIPEERRSLVPEYDDPIKTLQFLDKNMALLTTPAKPTPPSLDGGAGGQAPPPVKLTDEERAFARSFGMTDEQYAEKKAKRGQPIDIHDPNRKKDT